MSKSVKAMIQRDYTARLGDTADAMVISVRGLKAIDTNKLRRGLAKSNIKVSVVRNSLAKRGFKGTSLEGLSAFLEGPSALAYGQTGKQVTVVDVAREIVKAIKDFPGLELKGAVLDGQVFKGDAGVKELSKFPTRAEAQAQAITLIVSPGRNLLGQIKGPGSKVAGLIKAIEEKLEKGEAIAKVA